MAVAGGGSPFEERNRILLRCEHVPFDNLLNLMLLPCADGLGNGPVIWNRVAGGAVDRGSKEGKTETRHVRFFEKVLFKKDLHNALISTGPNERSMELDFPAFHLGPIGVG